MTKEEYKKMEKELLKKDKMELIEQLNEIREDEECKTGILYNFWFYIDIEKSQIGNYRVLASKFEFFKPATKELVNHLYKRLKNKWSIGPSGLSEDLKYMRLELTMK